jgi:hypothetical protein
MSIPWYAVGSRRIIQNIYFSHSLDEELLELSIISSLGYGELSTGSNVFFVCMLDLPFYIIYHEIY